MSCSKYIVYIRPPAPHKLTHLRSWFNVGACRLGFNRASCYPTGVGLPRTVTTTTQPTEGHGGGKAAAGKFFVMRPALRLSIMHSIFAEIFARRPARCTFLARLEPCSPLSRRCHPTSRLPLPGGIRRSRAKVQSRGEKRTACHWQRLTKSMSGHVHEPAEHGPCPLSKTWMIVSASGRSRW